MTRYEHAIAILASFLSKTEEEVISMFGDNLLYAARSIYKTELKW